MKEEEVVSVVSMATLVIGRPYGFYEDEPGDQTYCFFCLHISILEKKFIFYNNQTEDGFGVDQKTFLAIRGLAVSHGFEFTRG